jgi:hypothetical protein
MNPFWVQIRVETMPSGKAYVGLLCVGLWSTPSLSCGVPHDIAKPLLEYSSLTCMPFVLAPIKKLLQRMNATNVLKKSGMSNLYDEWW